MTPFCRAHVPCSSRTTHHRIRTDAHARAPVRIRASIHPESPTTIIISAITELVPSRAIKPKPAILKRNRSRTRRNNRKSHAGRNNQKSRELIVMEKYINALTEQNALILKKYHLLTEEHSILKNKLVVLNKIIGKK